MRQAYNAAWVMRRFSISIFLYLALAGLLASCSSSTDFVIINSTDREIEVRYQFKVRNEVHYPAALSVEDFKARKEWHWLSEAGSQFQLDDTGTTFTYKL